MTARIKFARKPVKIVESILYLALKGVQLDQYKLVKLLYLADREHLRRFGRPITFDKYVAMEFGPVASCAYDIVRGKKVHGFDADLLPFELERHDKVISVVRPKREIVHDEFSRSDLAVLDEIADMYGDKSFSDLYELTHEHFAYHRAWSNRSTKADEMRFEDFLEEDETKERRVSDLEFAARGM